MSAAASTVAGTPWGVHDVRAAGELALALGPLEIRLAERDGEIRAACRRGEAAVGPGADSPGGWARWGASGWNGRVSLSPHFPDRPVVVEPESAFGLLRGAEARIYVRVPLWVQVEALGEESTPLFRIPTLAASDTWWGTMEQGELCYWIPTSARRTYDDSLFQPHLAMCPVQLVNLSAGALPVSRVALRVAHLSLYASGNRIWADETRVAYQGETEGSQLDIGGEPPREAAGAALLTPPRMRMPRGFRALTFASLNRF